MNWPICSTGGLLKWACGLVFLSGFWWRAYFSIGYSGKSWISYANHRIPFFLEFTLPIKNEKTAEFHLQRFYIMFTDIVVCIFVAYQNRITYKNEVIMGLFDYIFKSKKEREQEVQVKDVLKRTDDFIERTERMLDKMEKDDKAWKKNIGY